MSFQDIQRVTRIEEDTREKKLQAQAQARQIIAEAQKAGTAAVEAARRQARDQVSQWMEEAERLGRESMSPQAVGGAVGRNPISIIIPCHRVVGADGSLTGYAGGLERKRWLLAWEGCQIREKK